MFITKTYNIVYKKRDYHGLIALAMTANLAYNAQSLRGAAVNFSDEAIHNTLDNEKGKHKWL